MNNWKNVFAIIWASQFISLLTSSVVGYSIIFWLSIETQSAEVLAYAFVAGNLPQIVLGLFAGVYIDRLDRKRVMIAADIFIAFCTAILFLLLIFKSVHLGYFYILFSCRSIGSAFHTPAMQASIPILAPEEQITRIAGINQSLQSASTVLAPIIGASLISFGNIKYILLLDVVGALIACAALLFITIPSPKKSEEKRNMWKDLEECFLAIHSKKGLPFLFVSYTLVMFIILPLAVLFPFMTLDHFTGTPFQMGLIEALWGIGAILGGFAIATNNTMIKGCLLLSISYVLLGGSFLISGSLPISGYYYFAALTIIGGVAYTIFNSLFTAIIQLNMPPEILGRVFSLFFSISLLPAMISLILSGYITNYVGVTTVFVIGGGIIILVGILNFISPAIKRLKYN